MPARDLLADANRQLRICNACRYCEGYCAVFPAMERRRSFADGDLVYLANLCFECRACHYACPFVAPHEFDVNIPKVLARLRLQTYRHYTWPGRRRGSGAGVAWAAVASAVAVPLLTLAFVGPTVLFSTHFGGGAFYAVVPYTAMVAPALAMLLFGAGCLAAGAVRFWRDTGARVAQLLDLRALAHATRDALGLEYLKGGGDGCSYPDARFSHARRRLHHLVFYGFGLAFAATTVAAGYHHLLGWAAPYPLWSWPVALGTTGGVAMVAGCSGLLLLKWRSDPEPAEREMVRMDAAFLALLLWTSVTGLGLLALRETAAMGTLLAVHLGAVAGLFLTLPYGKFAHVAYRYAALVRNAIEESGRGAEDGA